MTDINKQPSGLSNSLGVRAGGTNPDDFSPSVRPVIDIEPFYAPDRMRAAIQSFSAAPQTIDFVEVPEGEVWKVIALAVVMTNYTVNQQTQGFFGIERIPGQGLNGIPWLSYEIASFQSFGTETVFASDVVPRIVTAGQRITHEVSNSDRNPSVGSMFVTYVLIDAGT